MSLGRAKAIEIFLEKSIKARVTLSRIERWDPKKTLKENAADLGIEYQFCVNLAKTYGLEFVRLKTFQF